MRWAQILIFLAVLTVITGGLHWFLWARLVRDPGWAVEITRWATRALWGMAATIPLSILLMRALPRPVMSALAWVAYVWMGLAFFLFMFLLVGWGVRAIAVAVDPSRREAMARLLAAGGGLAAIATGAVAIRVALDRVMVRTVRVTIPKLPAAFEGMSIVQLTDIHVGPTIGRDFIEGLVLRCNALDPDVVVITGDLVDGSVAELGEQVAPLRGLRAREGVFFVTGNHEYYSGVDEWLAHLRGMGMRVLRNERVELTRDGERIDLAGVDDWSAKRSKVEGHGADLDAALRGRDETRAVVLLAHQPKAVPQAATKEVDLVLSGHTHGGQIWPWSYLVKLDQPYLAGLHREGPTQVYVSEGTGYWGPPMRLGTHGEITKVVLSRV